MNIETTDLTGLTVHCGNFWGVNVSVHTAPKTANSLGSTLTTELGSRLRRIQDLSWSSWLWSQVKFSMYARKIACRKISLVNFEAILKNNSTDFQPALYCYIVGINVNEKCVRFVHITCTQISLFCHLQTLDSYRTFAEK